MAELKTGSTINGVTIMDELSVGDRQQGFKNKLINANFDIWQRGTAITTTTDNEYTADCWFANLAGTIVESAMSSMHELNDLVMHTTPSGLATHTGRLSQTIENAYYLSGEIVSLSFWAYRSSGVGNTSFTIYTGPTTDKFENPTSDFGFSADNSWVHHKITFTLPSIAIDDTLTLCLQHEHTNGTESKMMFANIQFEMGIAATPFEYPPIQYTIILCKRYYQKIYFGAYRSIGMLRGDNSEGGTGFILDIPLPNLMRVTTPECNIKGTFTLRTQKYDGTVADATSISASASYDTLTIRGASGNVSNNIVFFGQSQNNSGAYIEISTEI